MVSGAGGSLPPQGPEFHDAGATSPTSLKDQIEKYLNDIETAPSEHDLQDDLQDLGGYLDEHRSLLMQQMQNHGEDPGIVFNLISQLYNNPDITVSSVKNALNDILKCL